MAVITPPALTAPPTAPDPSDRSTFNARAYAWNAWEQNNQVPEMAAMGANVAANATDAYNSAAAAAVSQTAAAQAATNAAASANFKGTWSGLTGALAMPASVLHGGVIWGLLSSLADVTAQTPAPGSAYWTPLSGMPIVTVTGTSQAAISGCHYELTNVAATTVTLPASPAPGAQVYVTPCNGLATNILARNGQNIMSLAEDMTIDNMSVTVELRYINSTVGWRLI